MNPNEKSWQLLVYSILAEVPDIIQKKFILACLIWSKWCCYDFLWSTDVGCCKMCLDFFLCAIFLFWYFDITLLTILSWTISIHIWAESNFFDTYKNNRFWSPILILLVFQSLSCFCHGFIPILILVLFWLWTPKASFWQNQNIISSLVFHGLRRTSLTHHRSRYNPLHLPLKLGYRIEGLVTIPTTASECIADMQTLFFIYIDQCRTHYVSN